MIVGNVPVSIVSRAGGELDQRAQGSPVHFLDGPKRPAEASSGVRSADRVDRGHRRAVLCAVCSAHVADGGARIEVAGHHQHTFFNPAGVVYRVACFASAPGCRGVGPFSSEFSWFPGWRWQVALCASCSEHLGWLFDGDGSFAALIEDRIREANDE